MVTMNSAVFQVKYREETHLTTGYWNGNRFIWSRFSYSVCVCL